MRYANTEASNPVIRIYACKIVYDMLQIHNLTTTTTTSQKCLIYCHNFPHLSHFSFTYFYCHHVFLEWHPIPLLTPSFEHYPVNKNRKLKSWWFPLRIPQPWITPKCTMVHGAINLPSYVSSQWSPQWRLLGISIRLNQSVCRNHMSYIDRWKLR